MTAPATEGPRLSRLMLLPYPFAAAAVAINFFMFGLMGQWIGLPAIPPLVALSLPLGVPASWSFSLWVKGAIDEAEGRR
ncbi:hypothetical protein [Thioclava sp. IC9]|uniref:hypothetical protein n=1 Tax=Thioclava sp. IC9 TaxID=1973007 RepID=UPI000B540672|nr:hypothetical protein [Thioclava sp. IC9]OWY03451.1 hypothetical protein B6V76_11120 [Thioclava sp. IC9]